MVPEEERQRCLKLGISCKERKRSDWREDKYIKDEKTRSVMKTGYIEVSKGR